MKYFIPDHGETIEDAAVIYQGLRKPYAGGDPAEAAELAADQEWSDHDGWEWMTGSDAVLVVCDDDQEEVLGAFKINVHMTPEFEAIRTKWTLPEEKEPESPKPVPYWRQPVNQPTRYASVEEWQAEARRRFGENGMDWRFICPACSHVARVKDWKDAGAEEGEVAFSCVGRRLPHQTEMAEPGPCNYAGGGLFKINPVTVVYPDGTETHVFAFAEEESQ